MDPKLKILLVGDTSAERAELVVILEEHGFLARSTSTFELPFAAAHQQPDAVVVDAQKLGAKEVASLLQQCALECPVAIFSSKPSDELRALGPDAGVAEYFSGTSPRALAEAVERFARRAAQQAFARPGPAVDYVALARRSTREQFVAASQCPFLIGSSSLVRQDDAESTADILDPDLIRAIDQATREALGPSHPQRKIPERHARSNRNAYAIRGARQADAAEITIGRARDVDINIDHATISKLHARFRRVPGGLTVADAGSRNGSWASGRLLEPNGPPSPTLVSEDRLRFGELEFTYLSASAAWDVLRVNVR